MIAYLWIMSANEPVAHLVACRDLGSADAGLARRWTTEWRVFGRLHDAAIEVPLDYAGPQEMVDRERALADFGLLKRLGLNPLAVVGRFEWPPVNQANVFPAMGVGLQ